MFRDRGKQIINCLYYGTGFFFPITHTKNDLQRTIINSYVALSYAVGSPYSYFTNSWVEYRLFLDKIQKTFDLYSEKKKSANMSYIQNAQI